MLHLQCSILEWVAWLLGTIRFYQGSCLPRLTVVTAHEVSADVRPRSSIRQQLDEWEEDTRGRDNNFEGSCESGLPLKYALQCICIFKWEAWLLGLPGYIHWRLISLNSNEWIIRPLWLWWPKFWLKLPQFINYSQYHLFSVPECLFCIGF